MTTLTDYIKNSTGFGESTIATVMDSATNFLANSLRNGESVRLEGLGTFKIIDKPDRPGRNPRTGQPILFKASRRIKLAFSKSFIDSIQFDSNADLNPGKAIDETSYVLENPEALPEMPTAISPDLLPQSPYFAQLPEAIPLPETTTQPVAPSLAQSPSAPPPIPIELLTQSQAQLELMWQIKAPDNSFVEVPTADLTNWGVTANTPIYSPATGWQLAGKVPELAGIVV